jgi:hypothetical protein
MRFSLVIILVAAATSFVQPANASVTVLWSDVGGDVIASYSGTLDLSNYDFTGGFGIDRTGVLIGGSGGTENLFRGNVATDDTYYGAGDFAFVDSGLTANLEGTFSGTEQAFGFDASLTSDTFLFVEEGYLSGSQIDGEALFAGTSVAGIFGTDTFNTVVFDDGVNVVTFTTVPEPSTALFLCSSGALACLRRRRR